MEQCGRLWRNSGIVWKSMVKQWNSVEQCSGTVEVVQYGGTLEQCSGTAWWNIGTVWHSVVEQCGTVCWNRGTA